MRAVGVQFGRAGRAFFGAADSLGHAFAKHQRTLAHPHAHAALAARGIVNFQLRSRQNAQGLEAGPDLPAPVKLLHAQLAAARGIEQGREGLRFHCELRAKLRQRYAALW